MPTLQAHSGTWSVPAVMSSGLLFSFSIRNSGCSLSVPLPPASPSRGGLPGDLHGYRRPGHGGHYQRPRNWRDGARNPTPPVRSQLCPRLGGPAQPLTPSSSPASTFPQGHCSWGVKAGECPHHAAGWGSAGPLRSGYAVPVDTDPQDRSSGRGRRGQEKGRVATQE